MGNLNFTTPQVQQRLAQGYYDDIKVAGYTGTKAQLDAILAKAGVVMKAATASANGDAGLVPTPAMGAATRYLRSDGTWQVPPDNNTVYTHPTTAGNKHIPAGGLSGQILRWSADGTATWGEDNNTTYGIATAAANGLMSKEDKTKLNSCLVGDGVTKFQNITQAAYDALSSKDASTLYIITE